MTSLHFDFVLSKTKNILKILEYWLVDKQFLIFDVVQYDKKLY